MDMIKILKKNHETEIFRLEEDYENRIDRLEDDHSIEIIRLIEDYENRIIDRKEDIEHEDQRVEDIIEELNEARLSDSLSRNRLTDLKAKHKKEIEDIKKEHKRQSDKIVNLMGRK